MIDRKNSAIIYAEKQIADGLKSIENAKNGIENQKKFDDATVAICGLQKKNIENAKLRIEMKNDEIKIINKDILDNQTELDSVIKEMTGLNQTADKYIERRNSLRSKKEELQDNANKLLQKKLPLENELKNLQEKIEFFAYFLTT